MPFYDYRCQDCKRPVRLFFTFTEYDTAVPICAHCQSKNLQRRIKRVAIAKGEDARMDGLMDDDALANIDENDPKAMGRLMRKMSREMGEDLGEDFGEVVERLESGQSPDAIEEAMPGLADSGGGMGGVPPLDF